MQNSLPEKLKNNRVAELNDQFRKTGIGGEILPGFSITQLGQDMGRKIFQAVREYNAFGDDPHDEHNFGIIEIPTDNVAGIKFFFKINYYDHGRYIGRCSDPSNSEKTLRVMTIDLYYSPT